MEDYNLADIEKVKSALKELYLALSTLLATQNKLTSATDQASKTYLENAAVIKKLETAVKSANDQLEKHTAAQNKIILATDKASKAYKENAAEIKKAETAIRSNNDQIEKSNKTLANNKESLTIMGKAVKALKAEYSDLSDEQDKNGKTAVKAAEHTGKLSKTLGDQQKTAKESGEGIKYFEKSIDGIVSSLGNLEGSAGDFGPQLSSLTKGFNALKSGADVVKDGFTGIGGALKATGFGLLMLLVQSLEEYFSKDKIGIKRFHGLLAAIGVITSKINGLFQKLGKAVVDALFSPGDTIKKFWSGLVQTFGKTFSAMGEIITGVFTLDPGKIKTGVAQLGQEVNKATDSIKSGFNALKKEVTDTATELTKAYKAGYNSAEKKGTSGGKVVAKRYTRSASLPDAVAPETIINIENEKKQYDAQLDLLNDSLAKKLITQELYNQKSKELQAKYHQNIGNNFQLFVEDKLPGTLKQLQDIAAAESQAKLIDKDEKEIKKAILPGQKLAAEKQLITDKFNYEIRLAQGNKEKITELEVQKQQALTTLNQQYEQQRKEFALNTAQQVADKAFAIIGSNIKSSSDAKIKGLNNDKAKELSNKSLTATQRKAIEDKYKKKENDEKVKAFKAEQKASVLQAVVNGALAITKATSQTGVLAPFVLPAIVAATALQIATIVAQKPPAFAKGGQYTSDGRGALLPGYSRTDNTNAYLRSGEAIVVSEAMRNPWARNLVSAINVAHGGRDFSMPNTGRGYAIGGIYTDGGNANRYYNQPVNDIKDMANTLAYQMINNFPPIYVDVKDVNNQQNILAQTVNRVNL